MQAQDNPKLCECGCGQLAPIAKQTKARLGHVQGQPVRFICGHASKRTPHSYEVRNCGYDTPCWVWVRSVMKSGHGHVNAGGRYMPAHVAEWQKVHGPVPLGMQLHHRCENPPCVNPAHLIAITPAEHNRLHSPLDEDDVRSIRRRLVAGARSVDLAAEYGVSTFTIADIKRWRSWKDVA